MKPSTILLGSPPGRRRDSLELLLKTVPSVSGVHLADDLAGLVTAVQTQSPQGRQARQPCAIVVETTFAPACIWQLPSLLAAAGSRARLVVIVATAAEKDRALRAGADAALLRGFTAGALHRALSLPSAAT